MHPLRPFALPILLCLSAALAAADPEALAQGLTTAEDTPVPIVLRGVDADGDPLTFSIITTGTYGTISLVPPHSPEPKRPINQDFTGSSSAAATVWYYPPPDWNDLSSIHTNGEGLGDFRFDVSDGTSTSTLAWIRVYVTPVDDPPRVLAPIPDQLVVRGTLGNFLDYYRVDFSGFFYDPDVNHGNDTLSYEVSLQGLTELPTWFDWSPANAQITIGAESSTQTVTLSASDGTTTVSETFELESQAPYRVKPAVDTRTTAADWNDLAIWEWWNDGAGAWDTPPGLPGAADTVFLHAKRLILPNGAPVTIRNLYTLDQNELHGAGSGLTVTGHVFTRTRGGGGITVREGFLDVHDGWCWNNLTLDRCPLTVHGRLSVRDGIWQASGQPLSPIAVVSGATLAQVLPQGRSGYDLDSVTNHGALELYAIPESNHQPHWRRVEQHGSLIWNDSLRIEQTTWHPGSINQGPRLELAGDSGQDPANRHYVRAPLEVDELFVENTQDLVVDATNVTLDIPLIEFDGNTRIDVEGWADSGAAGTVRTPPEGPTIRADYIDFNGTEIVGDLRIEGHIRLRGTIRGAGTLTCFGTTTLGGPGAYGNLDLYKKLHQDASSTFWTSRGMAQAQVLFRTDVTAWSPLDVDCQNLYFRRGPYRYSLFGMRLSGLCQLVSYEGSQAEPIPELEIRESGVVSIAARPGGAQLRWYMPLRLQGQEGAWSIFSVGQGADVRLYEPVVHNDGIVVVRQGGRLELDPDSLVPGSGWWRLERGTLVAPGSGLHLSGQRFYGDGILEGSLNLVGSVLEPEYLHPLDLVFEPATLTITGDLAMDPASTVTLHALTASSPFERVVVGGDAVTQGDFQASWLHGTPPASPFAHQVFQATNRSGTFTSRALAVNEGGRRMRLATSATDLVLHWEDIPLNRALAIAAGQGGVPVATIPTISPSGPTATASGAAWRYAGLSVAMPHHLTLAPVGPTASN